MIKPPFFLAKPHLFLVLLSMLVYRLEYVVGLPDAGGHDIAVVLISYSRKCS